MFHRGGRSATAAAFDRFGRRAAPREFIRAGLVWLALLGLAEIIRGRSGRRVARGCSKRAFGERSQTNVLLREILLQLRPMRLKGGPISTIETNISFHAAIAADELNEKLSLIVGLQDDSHRIGPERFHLGDFVVEQR